MANRLKAALLAAALLGAGEAAAEAVAPFKDDRFGYPRVLEQSRDGAFHRYDYREMRDINGRDQIPERRAKRGYVDLSVNRSERERALAHPGGTVELFEYGAAAGARFAVIFVHGRGGDRRLGADDWTFGGNFNRLKNLAARSGGSYYVPSLPDFAAAGEAALRAVIGHVRSVSPGAPVVVACGSMGSLVCWDLAGDPAVAAGLGGLVILGGALAQGLTRTPLAAARVPIVFGHGENDGVYDWRAQFAAFEALRAAVPGYPARFALFATGSHGTPIRMIDWREALNFILAQPR